jgi:8-oxo-dGTP diphosphatase
MIGYKIQTRILVAIDCIIFGFDGSELKILLIKRGFEPARGKWSLMGGFVQQEEDFNSAAARILKQLTGLENVYMEQLHTFGHPGRDPIERTISIGYFALININDYQRQINEDYHAEWFSLKEKPELIFDHSDMVEMARARLCYKAAFHPILFELLPEKFTLPQLQSLYDGTYNTEFDKRNFSRKVISTGLLVKQKEKERGSSKRGAYYYKLNKKKYTAKFNAFLNFVSNPNIVQDTISS